MRENGGGRVGDVSKLSGVLFIYKLQGRDGETPSNGTNNWVFFQVSKIMVA